MEKLIIYIFSRYKGDPNHVETFLDLHINHNEKKYLKN